jgi:hypothetical protein
MQTLEGTSNHTAYVDFILLKGEGLQTSTPSSSEFFGRNRVDTVGRPLGAKPGLDGGDEDDTPSCSAVAQPACSASPSPSPAIVALLVSESRSRRSVACCAPIK